MLTDSLGKFQYYLPDFDSHAVTEEYLQQVLKKQVFTIKQENIKPGKLIAKANCFEIIDELTPLLNQIPLGFDMLNLPNKEWLINVLHTLKPGHAFFNSGLNILERKIPNE